MKNILKLINDYQDTVKVGVEDMQKQFHTRYLLKSWRSGIIPKSGVLVSGIEYDFHGVGMMVLIYGV